MHTRSDITFTVATLSKYNSNFNEKHCNYVKRVFRYLKSILDYDIIFIVKESVNLINYSNFNFTDTVNDRKFTKTFVFMLVNDFISH